MNGAGSVTLLGRRAPVSGAYAHAAGRDLIAGMRPEHVVVSRDRGAGRHPLRSRRRDAAQRAQRAVFARRQGRGVPGVGRRNRSRQVRPRPRKVWVRFAPSDCCCSTPRAASASRRRFIEGTVMAQLRPRQRLQDLPVARQGAGAGGEARQPRREGRRDRRAARLVGLRQDHHAAHDRRLRGRDQGAIRIGGKAIHTLPPAQRGVAMAFEGYSLYPPLTVRENIGFALLRERGASAESRSASSTSPSCWRSPTSSSAIPTLISGGQQQRAWLAPRAGAPRAGLAARRADGAARAAAPRHPARAAQGLSDRAQDDHGARHPRPDRGERARRPHRRDGEGRAAAVRHAGRDQAEPDQPVRRHLHRRAADEHLRRRHRAGGQRHVHQRPRPERAAGFPPESACGRSRQWRARAPRHPPAFDRDRRQGSADATGKVITNHWLGDQTHICFEIGGCTVVGVTDKPVEAQAGDALPVRFPLGAVHLFDAETGRALAHGLGQR